MCPCPPLDGFQGCCPFGGFVGARSQHILPGKAPRQLINKALHLRWELLITVHIWYVVPEWGPWALVEYLVSVKRSILLCQCSGQFPTVHDNWITHIPVLICREHSVCELMSSQAVACLRRLNHMGARERQANPTVTNCFEHEVCRGTFVG